MRQNITFLIGEKENYFPLKEESKGDHIFQCSKFNFQNLGSEADVNRKHTVINLMPISPENYKVLYKAMCLF